jgi:choline-sulfatase
VGRVTRTRGALGGTLALACVLLTRTACQRTSPPPNILLYVVDTLRYDAVECDGNDTIRTPAMDRIAQEGLRFARAYAAASWTRPSMASLLTGVYPSTHGAIGRTDALRAGMPLLASELRRLGYRTAAVYANPNIGRPFGFAEGFDDFIDLYPARYVHDQSVSRERVGTADNVVNRAIAWLQARPATPFFLLVFSVDPHAPYEPPAPYNTLYDGDYSGPIDGSIKTVFGLLAAAKLGQLPAARDIRHLRALYDGEVAFNDAQLSRLLVELDRLQLASRTVLLLTSDHGEEFYEHGFGDHGHSLYDELIHIPLVVRWPGHIAPARVYADAVQLIDLYPTLLHIAGGRASAAPGRDLLDLLLGGDGARVTSMAYAEENLDGHNLRAVILDHRKLIYDAARPAPLTFDLQTDTAEQHPMPSLPPPDLMMVMDQVARNSQPAAAGAPRRIRRDDLPQSVREAMESLGYGDPAKAP